MTTDDEARVDSLEARIAKLEAWATGHTEITHMPSEAKPAEAATANAQPGPRLRRLEETIAWQTLIPEDERDKIVDAARRDFSEEMAEREPPPLTDAEINLIAAKFPRNWSPVWLTFGRMVAEAQRKARRGER